MARENRTGTRFAVKAFSKEFLKKQSTGKESLKNEISIMRVLDHPNVISFHELHETQNSIYLVMELLRGGQIFKLTDNKLTKKKTKFVLKSVLQALSYLDDKGVIHRDLKPDNIIFKYPETNDYSQNIVKLVDFGLSTFWDLDSYLFVRCGTPGFVAPEVINVNKNNKSVKFSPKCDVFSVGIIFYFMLTGIIPYDGDSFKDVLRNNKNAVIDYNIEEMESVGQIEKDLLKQMPELKVQRRPTAKECLKHPYFVEDMKLSPEEVSMYEGVEHVKNIQKFQKRNKNNSKLSKDFDKKNNKKFKAKPDLEDVKSDMNSSAKLSNRIDSLASSRFPGSKNSSGMGGSPGSRRRKEFAENRCDSMYRRALLKGKDKSKKIVSKAKRRSSGGAGSAMGGGGYKEQASKFMN